MKIKTIALVAPAGNIKDLSDLEARIKLLEERVRVKKYYDLSNQSKYLSDSDKNRAKFLENAFLDDEVDLVLSIRGGYGSIRLLDKIDWGKIKNCNKYFAGSSDISILLAILSQKTSIKCFHSLMLTNGFLDSLEKNIKIIENEEFKLNLNLIKGGDARGIFWGGNLSSIVSMFPMRNLLPENDIILFLEDLNEPLYKIDKMLYQIYRYRDLREKIKGIVFGDFYFEHSEILPLLKEYSDLFSVPTYYSYDITHKKGNVTLPYGKYTGIEEIIMNYKIDEMMNKNI